MKLRILAFILAAIMTFNTIPVTAFATETADRGIRSRRSLYGSYQMLRG